MPHVQPDDLALAALGEPVLDDAARAHLATCDACAAELSTLAATVSVARTAGTHAGPEGLVPPSPEVWRRISAELELAPGLEPARGVEPAPRLAPDGVADRPEAPPARDDTSTAGPGSPGPGAVVPLTRARRRSTPWIAAAAAAGVVVGAAGGAWWAGRDDDDAAPTVVARATLDPLPGWDAAGAATVEEWSDGSRHLVLTLDGGQGGDGFHEVWLIDREVTRLVSLGVLEGSQGSFTVPDGLDLDDFAVVDVSEEPIDGDPAHSGDSIIRGVLGA